MEWGRSIFIIAVFFGVGFYIATSVGIKTIQENWPLYRCNPLYMPFASTLAPVPTTSRENFAFCLSDFMKSAAPALTRPLSYVQSMTLALTGSMVQSQETSQEEKAKQSEEVAVTFDGLFSMMGSMVAEFNILMSKLTDAQGKMMGVVVSLMYIITATQYAFVSMWNGIPGILIRFMGGK